MKKSVLTWGIALFTALFSISTSAAPTMPNNVSANVTSNSNITISWGSVSGATKYIREARIGSGSWMHSKEYLSTSVSFTNVAPNQYRYRVKACDASGCSGWKYSNTITIYDTPPAPSNVSAVIKNLDDVEINWSSALGADYYIREARIGSGAWINPVKYSGNIASFNDIAPNQYQYRVKACNYRGCSTWTYSNTINVTGAPDAPSQVTAVIQNNNDVTISWSTVSGASYYVREARIGTGSWIHPKEYTSTSVSFDNLTPNQYRYRVKACNSQDCSEWTYSNSVTIKTLNAPTKVSAAIQAGDDINLSWSSVAGAEHYVREVKVNNGSWFNSKVYSGTSDIFKDLYPNTYQYRVQACGDTRRDCSPWSYSEAITIINLPQGPEVVTATLKNNYDIEITWSVVRRALNYVFEVKVDNGKWLNREVYTVNTITESALKPQLYSYRVKACNNDGCSGWSHSNQVKVEDKPLQLKKTVFIHTDLLGSPVAESNQ
ncbi:fibronectin type III domain-containing protein [Pseudoalteromonas sp. CO348]|uniref:fibronectin type III domain-containing protein n=1 Tax=Pseudoalteromonas TaxID=53246 RepID=UPI001023D266|nr:MULTISPECIES: fibronectin type III domain-containing protein [Pseudoalteromonas]MCG9769375.1 fibronectin type III domain-containing protein [Pseudoalteromonas piscicida]RZG00131.1 fibronectin type III domain-containing protein [Pseudoalteromonas sp. CO348]